MRFTHSTESQLPLSPHLLPRPNLHGPILQPPSKPPVLHSSCPPPPVLLPLLAVLRSTPTKVSKPTNLSNSLPQHQPLRPPRSTVQAVTRGHVPRISRRRIQGEAVRVSAKLDLEFRISLQQPLSWPQSSTTSTSISSQQFWSSSTSSNSTTIHPGQPQKTSFSITVKILNKNQAKVPSIYLEEVLKGPMNDEMNQ